MKRGFQATLLAAATVAIGATAGTASAQSTPISTSRDLMVAHYDAPERASSSYETAFPRVLSEDERERYARVFAAIDAQDWETVEELLDGRRGDLLHQAALAEYFTHAQSPRISGERIAAWLEQGVHLPQAEQIGRMGAKRGVERIPDFPKAQGLRYQPEASKRIRPKTVRDGSLPDSDRQAILAAIKASDPTSAYAVLLEVDARLSPEARAEWRQRVAWSF
ncbi:MAG: hypothetical protein AAF692_06010 [Pseudomonadota bacterium]